MTVPGGEAPPAPTRSAAAVPAAGTGRLGIALAAVVGLVVRATYTLVWRSTDDLSYDAGVYRRRSAFLLDGGGFLSPDAWFFQRVRMPGAIHPPGTSVWLALADLAGFGTLTGMRLWGCLFGTATVALVGLLGREVAGAGVGVLAAAIAAVAPALWSYDPQLMAETPTQFATALALLLGYRFWRRPSPSAAAWLGASVALIALMRSEQLALAVLLVLPLTLLSRGTGRQRVVRLAAAALWCAAVLAPWVGWNVVRFEHPVTMASGLELSMSYAQCDRAWYGVETGYWSTFCGSEIRNDPANELLDESEMGRLYRERAGDYVAANRSRLPVVVLARVGRTLTFWNPLQQVELEASKNSRTEPVLLLALGSTWVAAALGAVALVLAPVRRRRLLPLLMPLVAGAAGAALTFGGIRYRAAGEIGLVVLAAVGIHALGLLASRGQGPRYPGPAATAAGPRRTATGAVRPGRGAAGG